MRTALDPVGGPHDQHLPLMLRALANLPWPLKCRIAADPGRWRFFSGLCRRVGWNSARLGWHAARNGPYQGLRFRATHVNQLWIPLGLYEPSVSLWLARLIREDRWGCRGRDVWDVGANVGAVSLLCARQGAARVLAFEPADANLVRLEEHRWANPGVASLIEVIPVAVSDADGETELLVGDAGAEAQIVGQGMHLWHDSKDGARAITVRTILLDSLLNDSRPGPAILKIDVEGAEELVLNGARRVLRQCRPAVVLEVHTVSAYRRCTEVLKQAGYNIRQIVGRRLRESGDEAIAYGHVLALHAEAGLKEGGRCHAC